VIKSALLSIVALSCAVLDLTAALGCNGAQEKKSPEEKWRLAVQAWTFNRFSFFEAVDKTASLGVGWIEAFPGQALCKEKKGARFHHTMSAEDRAAALDKLDSAGVTLVNYGVVGLPNDEAKCREVFAFAKEMGIETIVSEPPEDAFGLIDTLCEEYGINVAVHNHPTPSHYWNPDTVLKVATDRSKWIGACADTGHWSRSGVKPVEALKKLEGRIVSFHLKDLNEFGNKKAHDVPWGTGMSDVQAVLDEMKRQGFEGVFSIEYEHNWENSLPELQKCVEFFNAAVKKI